ncbi:MAG: UDP-3-O-(3-hydroxymyristoyl)glucosamine N-acyltransferase [Longimicrobiales bacterium]
MKPSAGVSPSAEPGAPFLHVNDLAALAGGRLEGDAEVRVSGIAPLDQATPDELGFLADRRYLKHLPGARARAILVSEALAPEAENVPSRIVVEDAYQALPNLIGAFYPTLPVAAGIHPSAVFGKDVHLGEGLSVGPYVVVGEGAQVGDGVRLGAHTVVGEGCVIGAGSVLHPHVVLYPGTRIGARVILHAGVRLGVDGFGFVAVEGEHRKIPQVGACVIEDDVEIGANSCIDRGSIGRTVVGKGTKMDNLVHLAHNVQVGEGVLMAAMVGISGSTKVGDGAMFGGQSGMVGHIEIGEGARIGAQAGVIGDIPPGETVSGYPARNNREYLRAMGMAFKLPDTLRQIGELEARIAALEASRDR